VIRRLTLSAISVKSLLVSTDMPNHSIFTSERPQHNAPARKFAEFSPAPGVFPWVP
jgi:hypothetical protein